MRISVIVCLLLSGLHSAFAGELNSVAIPTENGALAAHLGVHQLAFKLLVDHPVTYTFEVYEDGEVVSASRARVALVTNGVVPFEVSFSRTPNDDAWLVTVAHAVGTSQDTVEATLAESLAFPGPVSGVGTDKRMPIDGNGRLVLAAELATAPDGTPLPVSIDTAHRALVMRLEVNEEEPSAEGAPRNRLVQVAEGAVQSELSRLLGNDKLYILELTLLHNDVVMAEKAVMGPAGSYGLQHNDVSRGGFGLPPTQMCSLQLVPLEGGTLNAKVTVKELSSVEIGDDGNESWHSQEASRNHCVTFNTLEEVTLKNRSNTKLRYKISRFRHNTSRRMGMSAIYDAPPLGVGVEQALAKFDKVFHASSTRDK